jgi:phosphoheptose isomerase (EC 5.3.1.-)
MDQALQIIAAHSQDGMELRESFFKKEAAKIVEIAKIMAVALAQGNKIMFCGNGGSAADAQHLAAELTNRFMIERPPLAGIALTTDTSALTAIGNDYSFDYIFPNRCRLWGSLGIFLWAFPLPATARAFWKP